MPQELVINSIDTAFDAIVASLENVDEDFILKFADTFDIRIKLQGDQWAGNIDYKIANFVIELQNQIIKIHNNFSKEKINISSLQNKKKNLVVNITVEKGCTEIVARLCDVLSSLSDAFKNMESKHIMTTAIAVSLICSGAFTANALIAASVKREEKIEEEKTKREFAKIANNAISFARESTSHMEYISRQMKANDTMVLSEKSLTKAEAIETFRQPLKEIKDIAFKTYIIDDRYEVALVSFENSHVKLMLKGRSVKATTDFLPEDQKDVLYRLYKDADVAQIIPSIDLQVTAQIHDGEVKNAAIVGIGEKREHSVLLFRALAETLEKKDNRDTRQLLLPFVPFVQKESPALELPEGKSKPADHDK